MMDNMPDTININGVTYVRNMLDDPGILSIYPRIRNTPSNIALIRFLKSEERIMQLVAPNVSNPADSISAQASRLGMPVRCFKFDGEFYIIRTDYDLDSIDVIEFEEN